MQKAEPQHGQTQQHQPAAKQAKAASVESPQGEYIAQLETMMDSSPQAQKLGGLAAMMNNSPAMTAQRKLFDSIHNSPRQVAQKKAFDAIHNSPLQTAQRKKFDSLFGVTQRVEDEEPLQGKFETTQRVGEEEMLQGKFASDSPAQLEQQPAQLEASEKKPNNTGLPDNLKSGIENLSGLSMDNVKVHYNSSQPAQLNAHAYAQGTDIHVAPGQEQHLPHEAWHVVQQAQGRVQPTMQMKGGVPVNDDKGLEHEADVMGGKAAQTQLRPAPSQPSRQSHVHGYEKKGALNIPRSFISPITQRAIRVQNIDFDPMGGFFRHGTIDENNFYLGIRNILNAHPFQAGHKNIRAGVLQVVAQADFSHPDIDVLTTNIVAAITTEYTARGNPITAHNYQTSLTNAVRNGLVANIQANHAIDMDQAEAGGFDALRQRPNVVMSRAKGVANQIPYANLPGGVQNEVAARLTELRTERGALSAANLGTAQCFPTVFSADVCTRQRALRYQGNHTNNAGWLPAVVPPIDLVDAAANALLAAASPGLAQVLNDANGPALLAAGTTAASILRQEFRNLKNIHFGGLSDAQVKDSALAALCQGVSAYIEFSIAGGVSRMMYEPVSHSVYITAHYKWREGYNPFFQVTGFPAV